MAIFKTQTVDLAISHSQIALCDHTTYDNNRWDWGDLNVEQGSVLHPDCLTFDPLPDNAFGAFVHLHVADIFELDHQTQRAIVAPLKINDPDHIEIGSVPMQFKVELDLKRGIYNVHFEICEGDNEVFYKFTLIAQSRHSTVIRPHYLLDDRWGAEKGKELVVGKADRSFTMKLNRMQKYLRSLGIPKTFQIFNDISEEERSDIKRSIGWHPAGGCHCIAFDFEPGEGWSVFYAERGSRFDIQTFDNEANACYALIYRM